MSLICDSYFKLLGSPLFPEAPRAGPELVDWVWTSPRVVVSHDGKTDPTFNCGKQAALQLWEMSLDEFSVVAFGCTSGAMALGESCLDQAVAKGRRGVLVTDPGRAAVRALASLRLRRIALLTPYSQDVNQLVQAYLHARGIEVVFGVTLTSPESKLLGRTPPTRVAPRAIRDAAAQLGAESVDGVFISCNGLRCSAIIAELEASIGKPVITSAQALAWDCMRLADAYQPIAGKGRLLDPIEERRSEA